MRGSRSGAAGNPEILTKRRPLHAWDDAVAQWKSEGGEEIKAEYEEAFAAQ